MYVQYLVGRAAQGAVEMFQVVILCSGARGTVEKKMGTHLRTP